MTEEQRQVVPAVSFPERSANGGSPKLAIGFNLDAGKDEQRKMQIRVAGTGQVESAAASAVALEVSFWIPPKQGEGK